jgi:hypothetical protein
MYRKTSYLRPGYIELFKFKFPIYPGYLILRACFFDFFRHLKFHIYDPDKSHRCRFFEFSVFLVSVLNDKISTWIQFSVRSRHLLSFKTDTKDTENSKKQFKAQKKWILACFSHLCRAEKRTENLKLKSSIYPGP